MRLVTAGIDGISFEQSGILSVVLGFLNRCEHETFDGVMDSIGGNLSTPATWIKLLSGMSRLSHLFNWYRTCCV